jgi:ribonuclease D
MSKYVLHENDLPAGVTFGSALAIDSEFMGLNPWRDRLCLLQIYDGQPQSQVHMVRFDKGNDYAAPNLKKLLSDAARTKLIFFGRGDMRWIYKYLGVLLENVYCLKIASRVARTYTQAHDLEDVCKQVLGVKLVKEQQCSYWGAPDLKSEQLDYACNDVLYLHALKEKLSEMLAKEGRSKAAEGLFRCLPDVVRADMAGWYNEDHFAYFQPKT